MQVTQRLLWLVTLMCIALTTNGQSPKQYFILKDFKILANIEQPFRTGLSVGVDDYIYFEVLGKIRVGAWYGETYPLGMDDRSLSIYNKYQFIPHGALVWQVGASSGACKRMFRFVGAPVSNAELVWWERMITDDGANYVAGNYFLAKSAGELVFDINDNDPSNNQGSYNVRVAIVKRTAHINRNQFNFCPKQKPQSNRLDGYGNGWIQEGVSSMFYHGFNDSFRGQGKFSGCQCVYDQGTLLTGDTADGRNNQGTFDFGFWLMNGQADNMEARHLHLILDVLPHDLWVERLGSDRLMRYAPSRPF